jgi:predicted HTH transcriptional regulator
VNEERDQALLGELLTHDEQTWLEFKHDYADPKMIGERVSALGNAARLEGLERAFLVWGVEDGSRRVVGTTFEPTLARFKNQPLEMWLAQMLQPAPVLSFRVIKHPDGRVVLLEIPAPLDLPIEFDRTAYIRIGSATPRLSDYPERKKQLLDRLRPHIWEHGLASSFVQDDDVLRLLDYPTYFRLTKQPAVADPFAILDRLESDRLITRDVGGRWSITNLGAMLLAHDLNDFGSEFGRKGLRLVAYKGRTKADTVIRRIDGKRGYASGFEGLIKTINDLLPSREIIGNALRETVMLFPSIGVRELVANALIHQDMTVRGAGPTIDIFENRVEITNPGSPLMQVNRMIDLPPRSRNEAMASLMRRMGLCEEGGTGLDKAVIAIESLHLPPLDLREEAGSMQVVLHGPRPFADTTPAERVRAAYQHAVVKIISGDRLRNASLRERLGIDKGNESQVSGVIKATLSEGLIKPADPVHPRAGYIPFWA